LLGFGLPKHYASFSEMIFSDPFFWRTIEGKRLEEYDGGIVYIDEADKAEVDCKKIFGEGADSGRFGPHRLPPGWLVWMSGNRVGDRSGSTKELDHLINRQLYIDVTADIPSWNRWAFENNVMPLTIGFTNAYPQVVFSESVPEKQGPYCTPRSLVKIDRYLQVLKKHFGGVPDDATTQEEVAAGIGVDATRQLFVHLRLELQMPKFEEIVEKPTTAKVPETPDTMMLVCYNLAHRITKETAGAVIKYMGRLPKEFAVTFATSACQKTPSLVALPAFSKWASENSSLLAAIALRG
jgi:hypothetical protein